MLDITWHDSVLHCTELPCKSVQVQLLLEPLFASCPLGPENLMSSTRHYTLPALVTLNTAQVLYNLISQILEFHRLDEIEVPHQVFLTMQFTSLHVLVITCNTELSFWMLQSDSALTSSSCFPAKISHCWSG